MTIYVVIYYYYTLFFRFGFSLTCSINTTRDSHLNLYSSIDQPSFRFCSVHLINSWWQWRFCVFFLKLDCCISWYFCLALLNWSTFFFTSLSLSSFSTPPLTAISRIDLVLLLIVVAHAYLDGETDEKNKYIQNRQGGENNTGRTPWTKVETV